MLKTDVLAHFGGHTKTARALGLTRSAVHQWREIIPKGAAYQIQVVTAGALRVDPNLYRKPQKVA